MMIALKLKLKIRSEKKTKKTVRITTDGKDVKRCSTPVGSSILTILSWKAIAGRRTGMQSHETHPTCQKNFLSDKLPCWYHVSPLTAELFPTKAKLNLVALIYCTVTHCD